MLKRFKKVLELGAIADYKVKVEAIKSLKLLAERLDKDVIKSYQNEVVKVLGIAAVDRVPRVQLVAQEAKKAWERLNTGLEEVESKKEGKLEAMRHMFKLQRVVKQNKDMEVLMERWQSDNKYLMQGMGCGGGFVPLPDINQSKPQKKRQSIKKLILDFVYEKAKAQDDPKSNLLSKNESISQQQESNVIVKNKLSSIQSVKEQVIQVNELKASKDITLMKSHDELKSNAKEETKCVRDEVTSMQSLLVQDNVKKVPEDNIQTFAKQCTQPIDPNETESLLSSIKQEHQKRAGEGENRRIAADPEDIDESSIDLTDTLQQSNTHPTEILDDKTKEHNNQPIEINQSQNDSKNETAKFPQLKVEDELSISLLSTMQNREPQPIGIHDQYINAIKALKEGNTDSAINSILTKGKHNIDHIGDDLYLLELLMEIEDQSKIKRRIKESVLGRLNSIVREDIIKARLLDWIEDSLSSGKFWEYTKETQNELIDTLYISMNNTKGFKLYQKIMHTLKLTSH